MEFTKKFCDAIERDDWETAKSLADSTHGEVAKLATVVMSRHGNFERLESFVSVRAERAMDKFEKITKLLRVKTKCKFEGDEFTTSQEVIESIKSQIQDQQENRIYVGTIHSVKGLEYDTVYVMGVNDRMFELGSEEMNNLFYVAVTRAKSHLTIFRR